MSLASRLTGFYRLYRGMERFLDEKLTLEQCVSRVRANVVRREENFIDFARAVVLSNPESPYLKLLAHAGIDAGDLEQLVRREGLDSALATLRDEGVFVAAEEFKGFKPAVRGSAVFHFKPEDFDNRFVRAVYTSQSGGSLWRPVRVHVDLEHIGQTAVHYGFWFAANGWADNPLVYWTPAHVGIANSHLRCAKFNKKYTRWFAMAADADFRERLIAGTVHRIVSRRAGLSGPEPTPVSEVSRVSGYLAKLVSDGLRPCVRTTPSGAVRIALDGLQHGYRLEGVSFLLGGEALTAGRRETIEVSGARPYQTYGCSEAGPIACQCHQPDQADSVHLLQDTFAVVPRSRVIEDFGEIDALLVTGMRPAAPKVLINTELGDYGKIEQRPCGCLFGKSGCTTQLSAVRSFQKLTGEGMTVVGDDLLRILEQSLPKRFGGSMTDYQLQECSGPDGLTRYTLFASPQLGRLDEDAVKTFFLGELQRMKSHYALMVEIWKGSGNFEVRRDYPRLTSRGKLKPYRVVRDD
jgi:hypothetical protein